MHLTLPCVYCTVCCAGQLHDDGRCSSLYVFLSGLRDAGHRWTGWQN